MQKEKTEIGSQMARGKLKKLRVVLCSNFCEYLYPNTL